MANGRFFGPTKEQVLSKLREGRQTAAEVASHLAIQTSAARKHLERLLELGIIREEFVRGARGRPKKYYALTETGAELFPRRYDAVLNGVLDTLVTKHGEPHARGVLTEVAEDLSRPVSTAPSAKRIARTATLLNDLGFEVTVERHGRTVVVTSRNCPILRTAKEHRELVCEGLHAEILRRAAGAKRVERKRWIVDGDSVCTHTIET